TESLIDRQLSQDMDALLRLVSLARATRTSAKMNVRQPLAELRVQPGTDADRRAVERFGDQIQDELNIKRVTLHDTAKGPLLQFEVKLNMRTAGAKLGPRIKDVQAALAKADPAAIAEKVQAGQSIKIAGCVLDPADVVVQPKTATGWAGL